MKGRSLLALLVLLLAASPAWAQIAFDNGTTLAAMQTAAVGSWSHTSTGSNLVLVCGVTYWHNDATLTVNGITYNGVALTKIRTDTHSGDNTKESDLWYLIGPATGSNTVEVTMNKTAGNDWGAAVVSLTGVDQASPLDADNGASGDSTTISVSVTTVADNSWVVDNIFDRQSDATTNQTLRAGPLDGSMREAMASFGPKTPAGAVTMSWTKSTGEWVISAASFKPAGAARRLMVIQ